MILSHEHKFIYIKTKKTASSSIEIALSEICGPDDIITPIRPDLEGMRIKPGQNYRLDHPLVPKRPLLKRLLGRPERIYHPSVGYYEHMPAWRVRAYVGEDVWASYYKFTFERNPWDRQVSWYRYKTRNKSEAPSFDRFNRNFEKAYVCNYDLYSMNDEIVLDFVGSYENIGNDFEKAMSAVNLSGRVSLMKANVSKRANAAHGYREYYTDKSRALVSDWYAREISRFKYEF